MSKAHVVVVGGGPAGAASAILLARSGLRVVLVDKAAFPRPKPCAEYLSPANNHLLRDLGVQAALDASRPARLAGMTVYTRNGIRFAGTFARLPAYPASDEYGYSVQRIVLDDLLLNQAAAAGADVRVEWQATDLLSVEGGIGGVRGRTRAGRIEQIEAPLTIGADGLRSVVARRMGVVRPTGSLRRLALVSHWRGVAEVGSNGEIHLGQRFYAGVGDVGHGLTSVSLVAERSEFEQIGADKSGYYGRALRSLPALGPRLAGAERADDLLATGPFSHRVRRATATGAMLVGDAADFFDPLTGEGIYCALRGAYLIQQVAVPALGTGDLSAGRLAEYDRLRWRRFVGKWTVERLIQFFTSQPALMDRAALGMARRAELANLFVGVIGDYVPAQRILSPLFMARLLL